MNSLGRKNTAPDSRNGFSLIQLLAALALLGLMAAAARPLSKSISEMMKQRAAVTSVKQTVLTARARAMANPMIHCGVYFDLSKTKGRVLIFDDSDGPGEYLYDSAADRRYGQPVALPVGVKLDSVSSYPRVLFFRGDGSAYLSTKIQISTGARKDTLDVLASTGRVKVYR